MRTFCLFFLLCALFSSIWAEPLQSPTWGFRIDLPADYTYISGDGRNQFSFEGPSGAVFDIAVYNGMYKSIKDLIDHINLRLKNRGDVSFFEYSGKAAALIELQFDNFTGWGLCVELEEIDNTVPLLAAFAYDNSDRENLDLLHLSALDSIAPSGAEVRFPGPITEFGYPRGELKKNILANIGLETWIRENDAEAAQALIDREFALLRRYAFLDIWQEALIRFYRAIYRDSLDRLADAVFQLERNWYSVKNETRDQNIEQSRLLAQKALTWVQNFDYERDLQGSDFVNLVSAAIEGRGDCDSRAMLWAIILVQANIPSAIMVSREHSHAMGLADIPGRGARFEINGKQWLVAETTSKVDIGLIAQEQSGIEAWLGILFE